MTPDPSSPPPSPAPPPSPSADGVPPELDRGILALCTRRPVAMLMVVSTVVVFGAISFQQLPRNLMPDISYPTITVRTEYPGAAPVDVEDRISKRLESSLSQVKSLRRISSVSRAEISEIILEFAWGTEMTPATMEVREKVDQTILPDEVEKPTILRYDPTLDPILQLGFYRERDPDAPPLAPEEEIQELIDLRIQAEEEVEKDLELVAGVAAVEVRGGYEKEIRVDIDRKRVLARGVSFDFIRQRLADENLNRASGIIYEGEQARVVRSVNEFQSLDEIRNIILRRDADVPLRLGDVAEVYFGFKDPEVLTRYNGHPCVKIDLYKEADANVVEVARRVRDRIYGTKEEQRLLREMEEKEREAALGKPDEVAKAQAKKAGEKKKESRGRGGRRRGGMPQLIPFGGDEGPRKPAYLATRLAEDEKLVVMSDQSVFIQQSLDEVRVNAISGGLLAILILYLFLRNGWFTVMVGLSIPLSVIAAFAAMKIFDVSLNIMSLGGLALGVGMLVDNSIVVLESIFRCREDGDGPRLAAVRGGRAVATAVAASTLTTVAVFFPIVFVEGIAGQVFRDQAMTVVISLLASLAVSLTFIPTLVARRLGGGAPSAEDAGIARASFPPPRFIGALRSMRWRGPAILWNAPLAALIVINGCFRFAMEAIGWVLLRAAGLLALGGRRLGTRGSGGFRAAARPLLDAFDRVWKRFEDAYPRWILAALRRRARVVVAALAAAAVACFLFTRLGLELIPEVHQGEFLAEVSLPVGTAIEATDAIIKPIERDALGIPEVESIAATVGIEKESIKAGEQGEHTAQLLVRVKRDRSPAEAEEDVKAVLRRLLDAVPAISTSSFRSPVLFSFKTPIEVEIKGYNLRLLREISDRLTESMGGIASLKDIKSSMQPGYPEVQVKPNRELTTRHQLDVRAIGDSIRLGIEGVVATRFSEGDRKVDIRVRLREEDRASLEDLFAMVINPDAAAKLPLYDVADIQKGEGPAEIRRIGQSRAAVVTANLAGLDLGNATEAINGAIRGLRVSENYPEFSVGFGGQQSEMESSSRGLLRALLLAIFLVYVVMAAQFESLVQPFVILFSIPLAAVGVVPALWITGTPLSVIAFIGLIILAGIVVNNAIVLIDCINQFRRAGMAKLEAIAAAGRVRLRPIFMTTATTVLGLLPLTGALNAIPGAAALLGVGEGLEIRAPMAITVIAGLISSTLLTLVVVPVIYSFTDRGD